MVRVPRPKRTLLPGLGVAVAVLAAVVLAFTTTGAIVGKDRASVDTHADPGRAIIIVGPASAPPATTPLPRVTPAMAATPVAPRSVTVAASPTRATERQSAPEVTDTEPGSWRKLAAAPPPQAPPPPPASQPATAPPLLADGPLAPAAAVLADTTNGLANTLRSTTGALGAATTPLSPELAKIVVDTGDVLADALTGTGDLVGHLLGRRARR